MFLRPNRRSKDGKEHTYWSLVETVRTADGPRQKTLWLPGRTERFGTGALVEDGGSLQRTGREGAVETVSLASRASRGRSAGGARAGEQSTVERMRQFGACWLGWELWRRLELDQFFEERLDEQGVDVPWSRVTAVLAINRLCAPGSELAIEERWYPSTALDDLLGIAEGKINDTRLYRFLERILP